MRPRYIVIEQGCPECYEPLEIKNHTNSLQDARELKDKAIHGYIVDMQTGELVE